MSSENSDYGQFQCKDKEQHSVKNTPKLKKKKNVAAHGKKTEARR